LGENKRGQKGHHQRRFSQEGDVGDYRALRIPGIGRECGKEEGCAKKIQPIANINTRGEKRGSFSPNASKKNMRREGPYGIHLSKAQGGSVRRFARKARREPGQRETGGETGIKKKVLGRGALGGEGQRKKSTKQIDREFPNLWT